MKVNLPKLCLLVCLLCFDYSIVYAQTPEVNDEELYELSLEELMNVDIYSASKKVEKIFDSPLSSTTLTRREIENSGATSIPEALRLIPGIIVREQTSGNYDIHIRGFDNLIRYSNGIGHNSTITLVMIDGRPVYNPNVGGTYWETLPIGVNDVERIEVVRGPSSPLYGPNAGSGVINIITRNFGTTNTMVRGDIQYGTPNTVIGQLAVGTSLGQKSKLMVTGNLQKRDRHETQFFDTTTNSFVPNIDAVTPQAIVPGVTPAIPLADFIEDEKLALDQKGINLFFDHTVSDQVAFGFEAGYQDANALKYFTDNSYTYHTAVEDDSYYLNAHLTYHNLRVRGSYAAGFENTNKSNLTIDSRIDFEKFEMLAEYDIDLSEQLTVRPGLNIQYNHYDDTEYGGDADQNTFGTLNNDASITTVAASVRADYRPTDRLRFAGAARFDKYNIADDLDFSYQAMATYTTGSLLLRVAAGRSFYSQTILGSFIDLRLTNLVFLGNTDVNNTTIDLVEFGLRAKLSEKVSIDVEVFHQEIDDMLAAVFDAQGTPPVVIVKNVPTKATQNGITVSMNIVPSTAFQFKPFITAQHTTTKNLVNSVFGGLGLVTSFPADPSVVSITDEADHEATPAVYGGFYANYTKGKFNVGLNSYFMSDYTLYHVDQVGGALTGAPAPVNNLGDIDGKVIFSAKAAYQVHEHLKVYVNARNLLNANGREFYGVDENGSLYMLGAAFNW